MSSDLERQLANLKPGAHLCQIYENPGEQLAAAVPFIKAGLARKERCLYIGNDRSFDQVVRALEAAGVDVAEERRSGALQLLTQQNSYLVSGEFVPQAMIDFVRQAEAKALAEGYSGLRLTGEMTWALGPEPGCDRLIEYEAFLNNLLQNSRSVFLCQYDRSRFDASCIHDALRTHPLALLGGQVCTNLYYEPLEMVLGPEQMAGSSKLKQKRVDWWIAQLQRARAAEQARAPWKSSSKVNEDSRRPNRLPTSAAGNGTCAPMNSTGPTNCTACSACRRKQALFPTNSS